MEMFVDQSFIYWQESILNDWLIDNSCEIFYNHINNHDGYLTLEFQRQHAFIPHCKHFMYLRCWILVLFKKPNRFRQHWKVLKVIINARDTCMHDVFCKWVPSLDSRRIKIRPGTYCRGDSAHALVYSPESGESPFSSFIYFLSL